jgi:hypothetical protein
MNEAFGIKLWVVLLLANCELDKNGCGEVNLKNYKALGFIAC